MSGRDNAYVGFLAGRRAGVGHRYSIPMLGRGASNLGGFVVHWPAREPPLPGVTPCCSRCPSQCSWPFRLHAGQPAQKLRIIVFGAHPDDAELKAGGTAAKWAKLGHEVKMVSVTNGDIGHWREAGGPLAKRRLAEVKAAAKVLGVTTQVLDIHDGELEPNLENRRTITRLIREWKADIVISHRPWDYHPDHRYVGVLVQDAAYMVAVPHFCPGHRAAQGATRSFCTPTTTSRSRMPSGPTSWWRSMT